MASIFDGLDLSSVSMETSEPEESQFVPERGILGDLGTSVARGAVGTVGLLGSALETAGIENKLDEFAEEAPKKFDFLKKDVSEFIGEEGFIKRNIREGFESIVPSVAAGTPGAILGAKIGTAVAPGPGTLAGGTIGAILSMTGLFGLGTYGEAKKEYLAKNPNDFEGAHKFALEQGTIEAGGEAISTGVGIMSFGLGKAIKQPLKKTIKTLLKTSPKEFVKATLKTAGGELGTEVPQAVLQSLSREEAGLPTEGPVTAGVEAIIPALTMSFLFSSGAGIYKRQEQKKLLKNLQSDNMELRAATSDLIYHNLKKQDKEMADAWLNFASDKINKEEKFNINEDFVELGTEIGETVVDEGETALQVEDLKEDSRKLQAALDEGRTAEDAFEEAYGKQSVQDDIAASKVEEKLEVTKKTEEVTDEIVTEPIVVEETPAETKAPKETVKKTRATKKAEGVPEVPRGETKTEVSTEQRIAELTEKGKNGEATVEELRELGELRFGKEKFAEMSKGIDIKEAAEEQKAKDTKEAIESAPVQADQLKEVQEAGLAVGSESRGALATPETQEKAVSTTSPTTKGGTIKWVQEEAGKTRKDRSTIVMSKDHKSGKSFLLVKLKGGKWGLTVDGKESDTLFNNLDEAKAEAENLVKSEGLDWKREGKKKDGNAVSVAGPWTIKQVSPTAFHVLLNGKTHARTINGKKIQSIKAGETYATSVDPKAPKVTKRGEAATRDTNKLKKAPKTTSKKPSEKKVVPEVKVIKASKKEEQEFFKRLEEKAKRQKKTFITNEKGQAYILEDLANGIYKAGMSLGKFAKKIRAVLGKAYRAVRNKIKGLYEAAQNHLEKITLGKEVGGIGGSRASTANKGALAVARGMDKANKPMLDIMDKTGWFKARDGLWRFFIDDTKMDFNIDPLNPEYGEGSPLFSVITHNELSNAYPGTKKANALAKVKVQFEFDATNKSWKGAYNPKTDTIRINMAAQDHSGRFFKESARKDNIRGTLLHEIQHAIQKREGFARGGSAKTAALLNNRLMVNRLFGLTLGKGFKEEHNILTDVFINGREKIEEEILKELENTDSGGRITEEITDWVYAKQLSKIFSEEPSIGILAESDPELSHRLDLFDDVLRKRKGEEVDPLRDSKSYRALLGEIEARTATANQFKTPDQIVTEAKETNTIPLLDTGVPSISQPIVAGRTRSQEEEQLSETTIEREDRIVRDQTENVETFTPTQQFKKDTKQFFESAANVVRSIIQPLSTRLGNIDSKLSALIKAREAQASQRVRKQTNSALAFLKGLQNLSPEDYARLKAGLLNPQDRAIANKVLDANPELKKAFNQLQTEVLDVNETEAEKLGLLPNRIENWFPRVAKDPDAIFNAIQNSRDRNDDLIKNSLDRQIRKQREKIEKAGGKMTEQDRQAVIAKAIHNGRFNIIPKPGSSKERQLDHIPSGILQHYGTLEESVMTHIYEMNEAIFARRLTGDSNRGSKLHKLRQLGKKIENTKDTKKKKSLMTEWERLNELIDDVDQDMENSLGAQLDKLGIVPEKKDEAVRLIRSRVLQRGTHGAVQTLKNVGLGLTIGNPLSAITQLGDQAQNIFRNKTDAFGGMVEAIGNKDLTSRYDLDSPLREFGQESSSSKRLDTLLQWSGLKSFDMFGKESFLQATKNKWSKADLNEFTEKFKDYEQFLDGSLKEAHDSIVSNELSEDALTLLFAELSDTQPISLSETSEAFLGAGNLRIFWMLKQFALKQLDSVVRETTGEWKKGNKVGAVKNFIGLVGLLGLAGAGTDEIKNIILGRQSEDLPDAVMSNIMQLMFINRYSLEQGVNSGRIVEDYLAGILVPPVARQSGQVISDIVKTVQDGEVSVKSLANVPMVGRIAFDRFTEQGKEAELKRQRKRITEKIRDSVSNGADLGDIRRDINRYNREARKIEGLEVIKPSSIKRIQKEERKKIQE